MESISLLLPKINKNSIFTQAIIYAKIKKIILEFAQEKYSELILDFQDIKIFIKNKYNNQKIVQAQVCSQNSNFVIFLKMEKMDMEQYIANNLLKNGIITNQNNFYLEIVSK